jgi:uncharacterized protein (DUF302 family)
MLQKLLQALMPPAKMLTEFPHFSIYMPCKLAVYDDNGKTIISTMNMEIMLKAVGSCPELFVEATVLFNTLKNLMNSLSDDPVNIN